MNADRTQGVDADAKGPVGVAWLALLALATPWLLTYNTPPSPTFLNQAAAWGAWGFGLLLVARRVPTGGADGRGLGASWPLLAVLALLGLAAATAPWLNGLPGSLAMSALLTFAGAALVLLGGAALGASGRVQDAARLLFVPLLVAALLNVPVALIQVFHSEWAGNLLVAGASFAERASGNLRQPNHLSSLALWGLVALAWLHGGRGSWRLSLAWLAMLALVATIVLTGSRTGVVGLLVLAAWGGIDRTLPGRSRVLLLALPLTYALGWWLFRLWAMRSLGSADAIDRIAPGADYSSARFAIWSNALDLIGQHPWTGVGFGDFNFAWTLTPFPGRPQQFYDHAHNLPLHWIAELGLPLGLTLVAAMLLGLWRAFSAARTAAPAQRMALRGAFVLALLVGLHSLLEYPLWYAYFLLPTAFALGLCLGSHRAAAAPTPAAAPGRRTSLGLALGAALMLAGSALAVLDYRRVVVIFSPSARAAPLVERIAEGQRSVLFAHHAHYAAATIGSDPGPAVESFRQAAHFLLDTRLLTSGATAHAAAGDLARARYLADRLREFGLPAAEAFFADCAGDRPDPPFQCRPSDAALSHRDFR